MDDVSVVKGQDGYSVTIAVPQEEGRNKEVTITRVLRQAQRALTLALHKTTRASIADSQIADLQAAKAEALELPK